MVITFIKYLSKIMFNHSNEELRVSNLNENKVGLCILDKNSNTNTTKITRSTRVNGLKINKTEHCGTQEYEKRTSRAKTSLNRKSKLDIQNAFVDTNLEIKQKQDKNKVGASIGVQNINKCLISSEDNSILNEEYCSKSDESKLSFDDDLTIRFSQDPMISQDEPICDVRWDYGSPEIIKKVKKRRGHYSAESVKNAVANFNDAHLKPQKESFNYVGVMLHSRDLGIRTDRSKLHRAKERAVRKKQHGFQEMVVSFLQDMTRKQTAVDEESTSRSLESSTVTGQCHGDLSPAADDGAPGSSNANYWSDEDLFKDNSFLIEATCNSEQISGLTLDSEINMESSISEAKNEKKSFVTADVTLSPNTSIIPSSCVSICTDSSTNIKKSSSTLPPALLYSHRPEQPKQTLSTNIPTGKVVSNLSSQSSKVSACAASSKGSLSWARTNASAITGPCLNTMEGNNKVPLKKFNTFHSNISSNISDKCNLVRSNAETSMRKTLSFDSSYSSQSSAHKTSVNPHNPTLSKNRLQSNVPRNNNPISSKQPDKLVIHSKLPAPVESPALSSDDINLPEDVLRQLLEPDDILDSQEDNPVRRGSQNDPSAKTDSKSVNSAQLKPANKLVSDKTLNSTNMIHQAGSTVSNCDKNVKHANKFSSLNFAQEVQKTASLKPFQSKNSLPATGQRKSSPPNPTTSSSSKNVKQGNVVCSKQCEVPASTQTLTDSFIENVFNDSFLNDDAMYESQILPILDLVESEALKESQCTQQQKSSPPALCTSEEIERKRQAALQKRIFSLSQRKCLK